MELLQSSPIHAKRRRRKAGILTSLGRRSLLRTRAAIDHEKTSRPISLPSFGSGLSKFYVCSFVSAVLGCSARLKVFESRPRSFPRRKDSRGLAFRNLSPLGHPAVPSQSRTSGSTKSQGS